MSGHSKWHNIQAKKGKADAARGRIFTKIGREIAVAAKGNPNPETNSKLADVIAKAKAANMPNDNIQRSIKRAAGELSGADYKELTYEGYGPAGSAVIISALTDNNNRTAGDIRAIMGKHGGSMGNTGCVSYNFDNKGYIVIERTAELTEDAVTEYALEAGADDVAVSDDVYEIFTSPEAFSDVRKYFEEKNKELMAAAPKSRHGDEEEPKIRFVQAEVAMIPQNKITLPAEKVRIFTNMLEALEDLDDVQEVYHNVDLPDEDEE
ncbi:MAG: YebC/PmpR family DNA-binding transcriptional regulator [Candidatus Borkfalkiaceae bacterium]|nr:YebC/PmpR family DNA-binding transcriptional regulator [Clostridia bacterium]MDY6224145.1 YebC/PmpR family DNA-binding transcriptional regulator [Christensenellaceae bacterium]